MIYMAKTDGKTTLEAHVQHLHDQREEMLPFRSFVVQKYHERTGRPLDKMLFGAITWHDEGKKDAAWQKHCLSNSLHLAKARHELASLTALHHAKVNASAPIRAAIAAHHGKLGFKHEERWKERAEFVELDLWGQFRRMGNRADGLEAAIRQRYEFDGPRSWLQMADHRASAKEGAAILPEFRGFSYTFPPEYTKRGVQKNIAEIWDEPFAMLRAPTGAGKTDAALLWAQHQIECGRADRLVIAMPTRFTAKSLAISKPEEISTRGLYHSTSRFVHNANASQDKVMQGLAAKEQDMARLLETPITVTTLDHLCICLTGTREDHHSVFFNLAHSCVVIDEADFYDDFTQQNIVILLTALRLLNVPVLLMSATVPDSARQLYAASSFKIDRVHEDTSDSDRVRCRLRRMGSVIEPSDITSELKYARHNQPTIIYANTVRRAQAYYRWFQEYDSDFTADNVILYHSRFTEADKERKENYLVKMLGKEAWEQGTAHGIAILTQIGELSVNISADNMISDLCPVDRLAQRVGRLARFHNGGGDLLLVEPYHVRADGMAELYPAPYGEWNNRWIASEALVKSNELLSEGEYTARDFVKLVDKLYPAHNTELAERVRTNVRNFKVLIETNWLLLPAESKHDKDAEEDHTDTWHSRNIPPQRTLYVGYRPTGIVSLGDDDEPRTWAAFREFQLQHGVQCHVYEFNKAVQNGLLHEARDKTKFTLGRNHEEEVWTVPTQYYDFATGLHLTEESD